VHPDAAEPPAVEAFILVVRSRRSGGGGSGENRYRMLQCGFPILLFEAYCRNSTKAKNLDISLGPREISSGPREISLVSRDLNKRYS
jgi:hypothetical protein